MPRPGPLRPIVAIRLSNEGTTHIDKRAIDRGLIRGNGKPNRSEMIRIMLAYASSHMPKGWKP